jgi:hypothetical protein
MSSGDEFPMNLLKRGTKTAYSPNGLEYAFSEVRPIGGPKTGAERFRSDPRGSKDVPLADDPSCLASAGGHVPQCDSHNPAPRIKVASVFVGDGHASLILII